jgi:hypothetical protein
MSGSSAGSRENLSVGPQRARVAADNPAVYYAIGAVVVLLAYVVRDMTRRF